MHKKKGKPIADLLKKKQTEQVQKKQSESDSYTDEESDEFTESDSSSDSEDYEDYRKDGYHPVFIGENFNNGRYQIIQKLGWGHFSTVWLVLDRKESKHFALKIQKSKPSYQEAAIDEVQMLKHMQNKQNDQQWVEIYKSISQYDNKDQDTYCVKMIDNFAHFGIHGKHYCIVFEVLGPSLLDLINHYHKSNSMMPLWLAKQITRQILIGLVYMHNVCGLIHTDLKPENVMLQLKPEEFDQFVEDLKKYDRVPVSMRFLEDMSKSTRNPNRQKKQKSKNQGKKEEINQIKQDEDQQKTIEPQIESKTDITNDYQTHEKVVIEQPYQFEKQEATLKNQEQTEQQQNTEESSEKQQQIDQIDQITEQQQVNQKQEQQLDQQIQQQTSKLNLDTLIWKKHIEIKLDNSLQIKIVDLGNACWINKHFTNNIQTREYRSPEAILGIDYDETTDIWSLACLMFELITNDYLFRPEKKSHYSRDEDHLALMQEALGKIPKKFALSGTQSREFFNKNGQLINIKDLKFLTISELLIDQYQFQKEIAQQIEDFLRPMLEFDPKKRISALKALQNPWLWN